MNAICFGSDLYHLESENKKDKMSQFEICI